MMPLLKQDYIFFLLAHTKYKGSIGIQCPPVPGPGEKAVKPKFFVLAASSKTARLLLLMPPTDIFTVMISINTAFNQNGVSNSSLSVL